MASTLELRQVQKGKTGRIHLAVPGKAEASARTLCNKLFEAGEYREVDDQADCQLCGRRRDDKALVSSAFFEGDMGSQLLEMSLEQAKAGRSRRQAERAGSAASRLAQPPEDSEEQGSRRDRGRGRQAAAPDDREQSSAADDRAPARGGAAQRRGDARGRPQLTVMAEPEVAEPEKPAQLGNLALAGMQEVSDNVRKSPAGVVIRSRRRGKDWQVAEVVFDGAIQVKHDAGGRTQLKIGDIVVELSAEGGQVRVSYRVEGSS
jgi:hypothetical protein